VKQYIKPRKS